MELHTLIWMVLCENGWATPPTIKHYQIYYPFPCWSHNGEIKSHDLVLAFREQGKNTSTIFQNNLVDLLVSIFHLVLVCVVKASNINRGLAMLWDI